MTESEKKENDAMGFWKAHVAPNFHGILDGNGWSWSDEKQGYRSASGSWLAGSDMDALARSVLVSAEAELEQNAISLLPNVSEWFHRMNHLTTTEMIVLGFFAEGGIGNLDEKSKAAIEGMESTDDRVGSGLSDIRMRLNNFASELRDGDAGSMKQVTNRSGLYSHAAWEVYQECRRISHEKATDEYGRKLFLFEKNILDDQAHHCFTTSSFPGCPEQTAKGWVPIGTLPAPGKRMCGANCRCRLSFALMPDTFGD